MTIGFLLRLKPYCLCAKYLKSAVICAKRRCTQPAGTGNEMLFRTFLILVFSHTEYLELIFEIIAGNKNIN
jgi:hypothetical protein